MNINYITKVLNTAGKEISKEKRIPNHAYVFFTCEVCGEKGNKKERRRIAKQDDYLLCPACAKKYTNQKKYGYDSWHSSPKAKAELSKTAKQKDRKSVV